MIDETRRNELAVANSQGGAAAIYQKISDPINAVQELGKFYHQSGMLGVKTPGAGAVLALHCMCERITPIEFKRKYHIMHDGNISMRADAMLAELRNLGGKYKIINRTPEKAEIELSFEDNTATFAMTIEDAKQERYYYAKDGKTPKDNWSTPRGAMQMLWARVVSDGVNTICPEVKLGTYTPEEIADFDDAPTDANGNPTEIVDAEYEVQPEPEARPEPEPEPQPEPQPEPAKAVASASQIDEIYSLAETLGQKPEAVVTAVQKNYRADSPEGLTAEQAQEMIQRMKGIIEKKSATAAK